MQLKRINGELIGEGNSIREIAENNKSNLSSSNLRYSDLRSSDLRFSDLSSSNLSSSDLSSSDLSSSDLRYSDLRYSDLSYSNLSSAIFNQTKRGKWLINTSPIQITGLKYKVIIFTEHMEIGCEHHSFAEWLEYTDKEILAMNGKEAIDFWNDNKWFLLSLCEKQSLKHNTEKELK